MKKKGGGWCYPQNFQVGIFCHLSTREVKKRTLQRAGCVLWFGTKNERWAWGGWTEITVGIFFFFPEKVIRKLCGAGAKAARCPGIKKSIPISQIITTLDFCELEPSFWPWEWPGCPWPAPVLTRQPEESLWTVRAGAPRSGTCKEAGQQVPGCMLQSLATQN